MTIDGITIEVIQKDIRSFRLTVRSPHGEVRISVPHRMDEGIVQRFLISKMDWIRKHQARMHKQQWIAPPQYVTGERHSFLGKKYELRLCTGAARSKVTLTGEVMELHLRHRSGRSSRMALLDEWYRDQLRKIVPAMIERYEHVMHVTVAEWGIKKMKTKWGTCNITMRRIWLNLELAKKPLHDIEHVIVHEMVHLLERKHNKRFKDLMDRFYPDWKKRKIEMEWCGIENDGIRIV